MLKVHVIVEDSNDTVGDVIDSMTPRQRQVLDYVVSQALRRAM